MTALWIAALLAAELPRLDDAGDRRTFRRWFTFLAEAQHYRDRPEPGDCAALVRFAFREALRHHDGPWASALALPRVPAEGSVRQYNYPRTPVGPRLFRVSGGAQAEFADAGTLWRYNTHRIARDLAGARPGDLLFYRQLEQDLPFHVMVYLGESQFESGGRWIVYHTGPGGEVRRTSVDELLRHPSPRWRPRAGNGNFLGVFRWNILRE
ncbi:MAG: DUF1175 family protein [Bryobacteraceae bacterium]